MRGLVSRRAQLQAAIVAMCVVTTGVVHANPPARPAANKGAELWAKGRKAAMVNDIDGAVAAWREAWTYWPNDPDVACNVGQLELFRKEYPEAATWLNRCTRLAPDTSFEAIDQLRERTLDLITAREKVSRLVITAEEGLRIVVDSGAVRTAPLSEEVIVLPGKHVIEAYKDGRALTREIVTEAGKEYPIVLELPRPPLMVAKAETKAPDATPVAPNVAIPRLPGRYIMVIGSEGRLPWYLRDKGQPSDPYPGPYRILPVVIGGVLTGAALASTVAFAIQSVNTTDPHDEKMYDAAKILSLVGAVTFASATIGYAIYEDRRTSYTTVGGSVSWSHKW